MLGSIIVDMEYLFSDTVWVYKGQGAWYFVTVPEQISVGIKIISDSTGKIPFGSVEVSVYIGKSEWQTSLFPDSKSGCYLLPIKKSIRLKERIQAGDKVSVRLKILKMV